MLQLYGLINSDQVGFMPLGETIDGTRWILNLLQVANSWRIHSVLLSLHSGSFGQDTLGIYETDFG